MMLFVSYNSKPFAQLPTIVHRVAQDVEYTPSNTIF